MSSSTKVDQISLFRLSSTAKASIRLLLLSVGIPVLLLSLSSSSLVHGFHPLHAVQRSGSLKMATREGARVPDWLLEQETLPFSCTECGKCCQRDKGDVYMSPDEVVGAAKTLDMDVTDFIRTYSTHTLLRENHEVPWVHLQNKPTEDGLSACVFLDPETKHCKIYQARPLQCQAYPFYENLLASPEAWNDECRRLDDDTESDLPVWTSSTMGCEGMKPIGTKMQDGVPLERALDYLIRFQKLEDEMFGRNTR